MASGSLNIKDDIVQSMSTLPTPPPTTGTFYVTNGDSTFPYPYGRLDIRYSSYEQEMVAMFYTTGIDNRVYYNTYLNGWTGWKQVGYRTFYIEGPITFSSDYGVCDINVSQHMNSWEHILAVTPIYIFEYTCFPDIYTVINGKQSFCVISQSLKGQTVSMYKAYVMVGIGGVL